MYFEVQNTPERVRKERRRKVTQKVELEEEECPRLNLAPFSKPPQVVFDNVPIGTTCEKYLEIANTTKNVQQITLGKALPPGLVFDLPEQYLTIEPETCYCVTMTWTPSQPTALRETIRFTNSGRARYDIIIVLKTAMNVKSKTKRTSPGKVQKKSNKKSPVAQKKKVEAIIKEVKTVQKTSQRTIVETTHYRVTEQIYQINDSFESYDKRIPFRSITSSESLNTSELFPNVLKPSRNENLDMSASSIFDKLSFTPLKNLPCRNKELTKAPNVNTYSISDHDDSLELRSSNKENENHSIMYVTSTQSNKLIPVDRMLYLDNIQNSKTPTMPLKKVPYTSSPEESAASNFTMNTDFSRISDISFYPQIVSTERKCLPKISNETQDVTNPNLKLNSDTYTKDSPSGGTLEYEANLLHSEMRHLPKEPLKICRQALFTEYSQRETVKQKNYMLSPGQNAWHNDLQNIRSPPRSLTPPLPLMSIPEENEHEGHVLDQSNKKTTFTINRTYDHCETSSVSVRQEKGWSKKAVKAEPEIWKVPAPMPKKTKTYNNKTLNQNSLINNVTSIYSQSFTIDPFSSSSYFYNEHEVEKFETDFRKWLNYILTPPADLESNIDQKIDVGKVWIENRNKDVSLAPTKEQVSSAYHNNQRLESLRRSARVLLLSPEISQVIIKLNVQIEKKLIAIRNDKNLHLDVGLQKMIMEILLSYNPLWLRIGLEVVYDVVLPLKSNSDIEGLTMFIIQRMFKNPLLKNKNSKSSAPNLLLPAYMEAIKKFTLKKFFKLVFFLDQAKMKKIISHDPCLFRRNAICKESREIIIRFTRELIAGIGDITKHLRPLGYVVTHKQTYLHEYKYAVHNLALDIKDGVRLAKVAEIILMKDNLLSQLRTPAISRLQKIHNVQVALNAFKQANFIVQGDITAADIADGHREKTLSLLWQLIHVFRAPLFMKAANVIQTWWRKKYEVIVEKRREEERILIKRHRAASIVQYWWRQIKYQRLVEHQTRAVTVIQKYCRMWSSKSRFKKMKSSAIKIAGWYKDMKEIQKSKAVLEVLRLERETVRRNSATLIQAEVRSWLCKKRYNEIRTKIIIVQSVVRLYLARKRYIKLLKTIKYVQCWYRSILLMRKEREHYIQKRHSATLIQSYFKMYKQRQYFKTLKKSVQIIELRFKALLLMRAQRNQYLKLRQTTIKIQSLWRCKLMRREYLEKRNCIVYLQRKLRANRAMIKEKENYMRYRNSAIVLQKHFRAYMAGKRAREDYIALKNSVLVIQKYYRSFQQMKTERNKYLLLRRSTRKIQTWYRSILIMRCERTAYLKFKTSVIVIQRRYICLIEMRKCKQNYQELRNATIITQRRYKAKLKMRELRSEYMKIKSSCIFIQKMFRSYLEGKRQRQFFIKQKESAIKIQKWYRNCKILQEHKFRVLKITLIQSIVRMQICRKRFIRMRAAAVTIKNYYRNYKLAKMERQNYLKLRESAVKIQKWYRDCKVLQKEKIRIQKITLIQSYVRMQICRKRFKAILTAVITIQKLYRNYKLAKTERKNYLKLQESAVKIQKWYRNCKVLHKEKIKIQKITLIQSFVRMQIYRKRFKAILTAVITIQKLYRNYILAKTERYNYLKLQESAIKIQKWYRNYKVLQKEKIRIQKIILIQSFVRMQICRKRFKAILTAVITIQMLYRNYKLAKMERQNYLKIQKSTVIIQKWYRNCKVLQKEKIRIHKITLIQSFVRMQICHKRFKAILTAVITIQKLYRNYKLAKTERHKYLKLQESAVKIQKWYRHCKLIEKENNRLQKIILIQSIVRMQICRKRLNTIRAAVISIQKYYRSYKTAKFEREKYVRLKESAIKIEKWYRHCKVVQNERIREKKIVLVQAVVRMQICRKRFITMRESAITIQHYYRSYKLSKTEREKYLRLKSSITKLQAHVRGFIERKRYIRLKSAVLVMQAVYRFKRHMILLKARREKAAVCVQKYVRRYLIQYWFKRYIKNVKYIQTQWRSKLLTRQIRFEFLKKKELITRLQAVIRGNLVRKEVQIKREVLIREKKERRLNWAASKIQSLYRGYVVRRDSSERVAALRARWRAGALKSDKATLGERNEYALAVLRAFHEDSAKWITSFRALELLTEVVPMFYNDISPGVARTVYRYISMINRSQSSVVMLKSAAAILVNFARYSVTGPKTYERPYIELILKFMSRYCGSEPQLFCRFATCLWLFAKYHNVRQDLTEFLHEPENHTIMLMLQTNVRRLRKMSENTRNKVNLNQSLRGKACKVLPALEPDYGIRRVDKPKYFEDSLIAVSCIFDVYELCSNAK